MCYQTFIQMNPLYRLDVCYIHNIPNTLQTQHQAAQTPKCLNTKFIVCIAVIALALYIFDFAFENIDRNFHK